MRRLTLLILTTLSFAAQAAPQTADCGRNLSQVETIVRSKFNGVFPANYAEKFVGTWSSRMTSFNITPGEAFIFGGGAYQVCPQTDQSFYFEKIDDPTQSGYLRLNGNTMKVYNGKGMISMACGTFSRGAGQ